MNEQLPRLNDRILVLLPPIALPGSAGSTNKGDSRQNRLRPAEIGQNVAMGQFNYVYGETLGKVLNTGATRVYQSEDGLIGLMRTYRHMNLQREVYFPWQHQEKEFCSEEDARNWLYGQLKCENGLAGCIMPGYHLPEECHTAEMLEQQFQDVDD